MLLGLHHIQLAMPKGSDARARSFYAEILGLTEVEKPNALSSRGGLWFEHGAIRLHLGIEEPFTPARKAHPAFQVVSLATTKIRLEQSNVAYRTDIDLPGVRRIYVDDPFGNRIELLEVLPIPPPAPP